LDVRDLENVEGVVAHIDDIEYLPLIRLHREDRVTVRDREGSERNDPTLDRFESGFCHTTRSSPVPEVACGMARSIPAHRCPADQRRSSPTRPADLPRPEDVVVG